MAPPDLLVKRMTFPLSLHYIFNTGFAALQSQKKDNAVSVTLNTKLLRLIRTATWATTAVTWTR